MTKQLNLLPTIFSLLIAGTVPDDYFQQDVDYEIHVTLDDSTHTLTGHESILYTNNSPDTLTFLWFHLWPNAYKNTETAFAKQMWKFNRTKFYFSKEDDRGYIDSLDFFIDSTQAKWDYHEEWEDVAKIQLPEPLFPGSSIKIETPFFIKIPIVFSRFGHSGKHYEMTQWYPKPAVYDKFGWHPMPYLNMGEFYSEFGSFDVFITLPEDYIVGATGVLHADDPEYTWLDSLAEEGAKLNDLDKKELKKKLKKDKKSDKGFLKKISELLSKSENTPEQIITTKTLHFHQDKVHDFAWFADKDYIVQKGNLKLPYSENDVTLWSMYLPKNAENWRHSIEYLHDSGYWYSKFYGDYPYEHLTAVDGDLSAGGGMEYPNITVIAKMPTKDLLEMVIMHEVGHNWFYGILGSNERDHAWMDEGLNEFTNIRYYEKKYGLNGQMKVLPKEWMHWFIMKKASFRWLVTYLGYQGRAFTQDDQPIDIPSTDFHRSNYGSMVYGKTAVFTYFLEHYIGEEKLDIVMKDFYETWKFKHPYPRDFADIVRSHLDNDVNWYLKDGLNSTKKIDYSITKTKRNLVFIENHGDLPAPLELEFKDKKNKTLATKWVDGFSGKKALIMPKGTKNVIIDPQEIMPDIDRTNNYLKKRGISFTTFFDEPNYSKHYLGNIIPVSTYNAYNISFGFGLKRGGSPVEKWTYNIYPSYDFNQNKPIGSISLGYKKYRWLNMDEAGFKMGIIRDQGKLTYKTEITAIIRKPVISNPNWKISLQSFYHQFTDTAAFSDNILLWNIDSDIRSHQITAKWSNRVSPLFRYHFQIKGWVAGKVIMSNSLENSIANGLSADLSLRYRLTKKLKTNIRFTYINTSNTDITQYTPRLGGWLDPDFESYVWDRTVSEPLELLPQAKFGLNGPSLRITPDYYASFSEGVGINWEFTGFPGPFSLFFDSVILIDQTIPVITKYFIGDTPVPTDFDQFYLLGLTLDMKLIKFYFPILVNWDMDLELGSQNWQNYIRAEFNMKFGSM